MKNLILIFSLISILFACEPQENTSSIHPVNWQKRIIPYSLSDSLTHGTTYLSVYSQIYSQGEHRTFNLTVTVSMRNTSRQDTLYIDKAEYFDTHGNSIRTYFDQTIFIAPMETVEIIIDETDQIGGTGANFIFDWQIKPNTNEPLFEGVMISTYGQQGLSFTTQGKRIN